MSFPAEPSELRRPTTSHQPPRGPGSDARRGRKKPSALARAASTNATSEPKSKSHLQKVRASGSQQSSSKGTKRSIKQERPKKASQSRNKPHNEPEKESGHATQVNFGGSLAPATASEDLMNRDSSKSVSKTISYSPAEVSGTGSIFADPSSLGFVKRAKSTPRPVPRYMFNQPRLLVPPPFHQDPWDEQNQRAMLRIEEANAGSDYQGTYEEFQKMREVERKRMEDLGLVDAENTRKDLSEAIFFQGTCLDMCPIFERTRRSLENNVKTLEKDPQTNRISRNRAIKAFSRPAAGQPPPMPSDVRPPHVLSSTLDYLIQEILPHLPEAHSFIWDRTRSIRQDFIYQNYYGPAAIDCNEKIVRIHLLSLHVMPGSDVEFSQQQELEQFNKALQTLTEIYQDVRHHGGQCPNEAEFRAYHLISHFRDSELERDLQMLPQTIFQDNMIQLAVIFRTLMSQNNIVERGYTNTIGATNLFVEFFRRVFDPKTPTLLAFLLETHFNEIRFYALKSLTRSHHTKGKPFSGKSLQVMLGFDDIEDLVSFVSYYDVDIVHENGEVLIDLCNKEKLETRYKLNSLQAKPKRSPAHSVQLNSSLQGKTYQDLVCAGHSNSNLHIELPKSDTVLPGSFETKTQAFPTNVKAVTPSFPNATASQNIPSNPPQTIGFGGRIIPGKSEPGSGSQAATFGATSQASKTPSFNLGSSSAFNDSKTSQQKFLNASVDTTNGFFAPSQSKGQSIPPQQPISIMPESKLPSASPDRFTPTPQARNAVPKPNLSSGNGPNQLSSNAPVENNEKEKIQKKNEKIENNFSSLEKKSGLFNTEAFPKAAMDLGLKHKMSNAVPEASAQPKPLGIQAHKQKQTLVEHPLYDCAAERVYEELSDNVLNEELLKILSKAQKMHQENAQRKLVIDALAEELYQAFISDELHKAVWKSLAKNFDNQRLKRKVISKVKRCCQSSMLSQEKKKKRLTELKEVQFKHPSLKRRSLATNGDTSFKRAQVSSLNTSFSSDLTRTSFIATPKHTQPSFTEKQTALERLWAPIDLTPFAEEISNQVKLKTQHSFKFLLVVENWSSMYSKWLNTKFNLQHSVDKTYYQHVVRAPMLDVTFESLPKNIKSIENSFSDAPFVAFESGIFEEAHKKQYTGLRQKLERDCEILQKLVNICDRFSLYKIQLLVVLWDTSHSGMGYAEMMNIIESKVHAECIQSIEVCDMSNKDEDVAEVLNNKVMRMSRSFQAVLSKRGLRKRKQLESQKRKHAFDSELGPSTTAHADASRSSQTLQEKEARALKRAKEMQKHSFLTKHASFNRSMDMTNTSMRTPNTTYANMTLVNLNNTILNNTFLNSNDVSFLKDRGILENTGANSSFSQPPLPRKLQELKDLTASIKAKYVREAGP